MMVPIKTNAQSTRSTQKGTEGERRWQIGSRAQRAAYPQSRQRIASAPGGD